MSTKNMFFWCLPKLGLDIGQGCKKVQAVGCATVLMWNTGKMRLGKREAVSVVLAPCEMFRG